MEERRTTVGGVPMRWLEAGAGPPVVLLHGLPTSPELWRHVAPRLGPGIRALAWELVGYGESIDAGAERDISVAGQAQHLASWLADLGIERAVLAGHDLGGGVAQIAAVRRPGLAAGLVLTNAVAYDAWPVPIVNAARELGDLLRHAPWPLAEAALRFVMAWAHDDSLLAAESCDIHLAHYAAHGGSEALVRQLEALDARDTVAVQDDLRRLDLPAAVIWGDADRYLPLQIGERLAADLGAPLDVIPDGRHFTPEDHPKEVAGAIRKVADRAFGPSPAPP